MNAPFLLRPIGIVESERSEPIDDDWDQIEATVQLTPAFEPDALAGLDEFSHVEIVFLFHLVSEDAINCSSRHPRGRKDWPKVGIFAQRGKDQPNRIGITTCRLIGVDGTSIRVSGLDAIDGAPVLDIKPCMREFLPRSEVRQPAWASELMKNYWRSIPD